MIQDEFTGLFYDPTAITNNLKKGSGEIKKNTRLKCITKINDDKEGVLTGFQRKKNHNI